MPATPLMQRPHPSRPSTLIVTKDSHTVKKKQRRQQPVIIYVESPKVVNAHPSEFRSIVQRFTGAPPSGGATSFSATALPPQFPFQMYGLANAALNTKYYDTDMNRGRGALLPFVASTMSPPTAGSSPPASYLPGGSRSLGSFFGGDQLMNPAFLFEDQNMAPASVAGPSSVVQANNLMLGSSSAPLLLPSVGCAGHVSRFIDQ